MTRMRPLLAALLAASCFAATAARSASLRTITTGSETWEHRATGVRLPPVAAGLSRVSISDYSTSEVDVVAQYANGDRTTQATLYLFRPAVQSVPLWFDRSRIEIGVRKADVIVDSASPPSAFTPPHSRTASGLMTDYRAVNGPIRSTALSAAPIGDWLLVVRISSQNPDRGALLATLQALNAALSWPHGKPGRVAVPVVDCTGPLALQPANPTKIDDAGALAEALIASVATSAKPDRKAVPPVWCRDRSDGARWGMYRPDNATDRYILAINDAGRVVDVEPSLSALLEDKGKASVSVMFQGLDETVTFPAFDALPPPEQALADLSQPPVSRVSRDGEGDTHIALPATGEAKPK